MKLKSKLPLFTSVTVLISILLIAFNAIYNFRIQALQDIENYKTEEETKIKNQLNDVINFAYSMIEQAYLSSTEESIRDTYGFGFGDTISEPLVKMIALNTMKITLENIRTWRFANNEGYIWINELEYPYIVVMHAAKPEIEGQANVYYLPGTKINVYEAYADVIRKNNGEGKLNYDFYKPGSDEKLPKVAYIKLFEPLGWVIGTGVYQDYIDKIVAQKTNDLNNRINGLVRTVVVIGIILIIIASIILYYFGNSISNPLKMIEMQLDEMSQGLIVKKLNIKRKDEIGQMKQSLDQLIDGFAAYSQFARQIGEGKLNTEFKLLSEKDNLGNSLLEMRSSLLRARKEEEKRNEENRRQQWSAEGQALLGNVIRSGSGDDTNMYVAMLKSLTEYVDAQMAGVYILNDSNKDDIFLEQKATVAYQKSKFIQLRIYPGDGLVGTCFLEKEKIYMTKLPDKYIEIHTGLGTTNPKNLLLIPLIMENTVYGVLEIASMTIFEDYVIDFIEKVSQSLAIAVASSRMRY